MRPHCVLELEKAFRFAERKQLEQPEADDFGAAERLATKERCGFWQAVLLLNEKG